VALLLALVFCYILLFRVRSSTGNRRFGIVIDCGSTGTRVHVFEYQITNGAPKFDFSNKGLVSMRVNPGLSDYAEDTDGAGESLDELVEFGKKRIPKEHWSNSEVRLMATAGLRMLEAGVQDRILESCRKVLRLSGFIFRDDWASVISGSDEGIYAWVVANYALGTLGGNPQHTTGIIELGGASAQVTFVSSEPIPPEFSRTVEYGNYTYKLYSHSLLQFGQNVAHDLLRGSLVAGGSYLETEAIEFGKLTDPCTPRGYVYRSIDSLTLTEKNKYISRLHPSGNFSECKSASLMLLQKGNEKCSYKRCYVGSAFIPSLKGKFLATENFFHTSKFFGLAPKAFLSHLSVAGQQFCETDWPTLKRKYKSLDEEDLLRYCFSSAYIVALLHDSLGIALDDERIEYADHVNNIPLDWALGAFILQSTADMNVRDNSNWITSLIRDYYYSKLGFLVFFIVLMFTAWSVLKKGSPQSKTIYDLEKGKYIITRISTRSS
jgi:apyrase